MDQLVGPLITSKPSVAASRTSLHGRYVSAIPLQAGHADILYKHLGREENGHRWTYMFGGPYLNEEEWQQTVDKWSTAPDPCFAILSGPESDAASEPVGMMSYMNIFPDHGRIEIGSVILGEVLKQTRMATEAFYLLIKHAFDDLNYLRVEWKANHLNKPSLAAAERLGFVFEGIFRNHMIIKGRRRDTAWFSITHEEWPIAKQAFEKWLSEDNFDQEGKQRKGLKEIRQSLSATKN